MRSINKVIIIGNLTRDAELRTTQTGQPVCTFGLATNREWVTRSSEQKKSTEFHECVAWAKMAEICSKFLKKGKLIYVEGYLKTRSREMPDGTKKFKTEIVVKDMIMLEKRPKEEDYIPETGDEFEAELETEPEFTEPQEEEQQQESQPVQNL